jgi:hypothetical protein
MLNLTWTVLDTTYEHWIVETQLITTEISCFIILAAGENCLSTICD